MREGEKARIRRPGWPWVVLLACSLFTASETEAAAPEPAEPPAPLHADTKWLKPYRAKLNDELPFPPSRVQTSPEDLELGDFDSSKTCAACHTDIYDQWKDSVMAHAWVDPIYRSLLQKASEATGGKVDNFCIGCHSPIGMVTGSIGKVEEERVPGVDCETCHSISARTGLDNGAFVLSKNGANVKHGPRSDAESPFHRTNYSDLHTRSDFCAVCHNVTHPFNGAAIERTYDEWLESPYAEQGVQCQDCHMGTAESSKGPLKKSAVMGKTRSNIAGHEFIGANTTLMNHLGFPETAKRSVELLRSAADIELLSAPESARPGETVTLVYKVKNVGAGHKLPTGFPEGREMWMDLRVTDGNGRTIFRSGAVKGGRTEPGTRNFKATMGDKHGNVVEIDVWKVTRVLSDTRIPPMGYAKADYTFEVPSDTRRSLHLKAELNYWPFSQRIADYLLGEGAMDVEIVTMDSLATEIPVERRQNAVAPREQAEPSKGLFASGTPPQQAEEQDL